MFLPNKECPLCVCVCCVCVCVCVCLCVCVCVCVCVPLQSNVIAQEACSRQELGELAESSVK